jgi:hypothetical protein
VRKIIAAVTALWPAFALAEVPPVPTFVEQTESAGLATRYLGDWQYFVGGGPAVFDCDGDGRLDIFLPGGEAASSLYRNLSEPGGDLRFEPVDGLSETAVTGSYPLDVDGDQITDLMILRVGENHLMRGLGNCQFMNANSLWGLDGGDAWSVAFSAIWESGATWPTLAVGNYLNRFEEAFPWGSCTDNWLHRPALAGAGFAPPLPLTPSFCALSMLFSDWSGTGLRDLRISNDREYYKGGEEQLWHFPPAEPPRLYTEAEGWARLRIWGMGIASRDLDGDGPNELFLTSMADNKLQVLAGPGTAPQYTDQAFARGATAHRPYIGEDLRPSTAWHAQFEDVNNDGLVDLFIAKGNVSTMPDFANADPNNLMLQRMDGTFFEAGALAGVASAQTSRGAALADFNGDGWLDLLVVNRWDPVQIWRNAGQGGQWLDVVLSQAGPNPDAIGAWIEVETDHLQRREITIGGGHASGQLGPAHFGLGAAQTARVRVIWPDGTRGDWAEGTAGQTLAMRR